MTEQRIRLSRGSERPSRWRKWLSGSDVRLPEYLQILIECAGWLIECGKELIESAERLIERGERLIELSESLVR